jgi:monoamine oxidase
LPVSVVTGLGFGVTALVDNRLFFAGEATSPNFFSTAHGAHNSGGRAAREVSVVRKVI